MDSNLQAHTIQAICHWLHKRYGYSKKECLAYIKGYEYCAKFMHDYQTLSFDTGDEPKEYYRITIPDIVMDNDTISDIVEGRGLKPLPPTE